MERYVTCRVELERLFEFSACDGAPLVRRLLPAPCCRCAPPWRRWWRRWRAAGGRCCRSSSLASSTCRRCERCGRCRRAGSCSRLQSGCAACVHSRPWLAGCSVLQQYQYMDSLDPEGLDPFAFQSLEDPEKGEPGYPRLQVGGADRQREPAAARFQPQRSIFQHPSIRSHRPVASCCSRLLLLPLSAYPPRLLMPAHAPAHLTLTDREPRLLQPRLPQAPHRGGGPAGRPGGE